MQSQVRSALKQQCLKYLTSSLNSDCDNNRRKTFWRFIKSQKQDTTGISTLQTPTDQVTIPKEIAETLNNQFKSVFTVEDLESIPEMPASSYPSINNIDIQWNLSIMVTLGPDVSGLYIQVAVIEKTCIRWSAAF